MASDGSVNIDSKIDGSGFSKGMSKLGSVAKGVLGSMAVAVGAGIAGIAALGKKSVEAYSNYEQLTGGVETLFKKSAPVVEKYAANAYKTAGMSANDYMETVTGFSASLLQSVGGNTAKAADVANMALTDMSDNANKMGTSMGSIQYAYQGFAKQNYTMLDNLKLGYGGTQEEMKRLLADAQKITGVKYDIHNLNDVYQAIHVIQGQLGITGTTAKEASTTIQGSFSSMKAAWDNLLTGLADPSQNFDTLLKNLIDSVGVFAQNIIPRVEIVLNGIAELVASLAPIIASKLPALTAQLLPKIVKIGLSIVTSLITGISQNLPQLVNAALQIASTLAAGFVQILPQLLELGVKIVIAIADGLSQNADKIVSGGTTLIEQLVDTLIKAAPQLAGAAVKLAQAFFSELAKQSPAEVPLVGAVLAALSYEKFKGPVGNIINEIKKIPGAFDNAKSGIGNFAKFAGDKFDTVRIVAMEAGDKFKEIGPKIGGALSTAGSTIGNFAKTAGSGLLNGIKTIGSGIGTLAQTIGTTLWGGLQKIGAFIMANPIVLVIAAVAALVAIIIHLWNTNEGFRNAVIGIWTAIVGFIQTVGTAIAGFFSAAWAGIQAVWGAAAGWFGNIWSGIQGVFSVVGSWFAGVFGAAWTGIKSIWSAVTSFFSGIWNGITRIFSVVGGWFKNVFSTAWNGVKNVWSAVTGFFSGIWSGIKKVFSVVGGWFRNIFSGAWSGIKNVWSGVSGWFGGVWSGITKVFSSVSGWFGARFRDAWNAITGVFKGIGGWFGNKFNEAKKAILSIFKPNMLSDTGRQLIEGLWNGIKNMGKWIKDKISGFGKGVLDSLKGFFGIHSPSTVFRDEIGKMIPPGIAIGFEKSTPSAIKDMQSEMAGMVSRMQASISAQQMKAGMYANAGTPQLIPALATAGAPTYNQTVNNYSPKALSPAESARLTRNSTRQMLLSVKKR